ncbi:MAG: serine/threonine-protein kinase, partial [Planctomycetota bacterium]
QCGKRFVLKVSSDTPPKVRVSKASPDRLDAQKRSVSTKATTTKATTTLASQRSAASREAMEATQADSVATQPRSSATGAHSVATQKSLVATQDGTVATQDGTVATQDGTVATQDVSVATRAASIAVRSGSQSADSDDFALQSASATLPDPPSGAPEQLGGYRLNRLLGRGAMGAVYEARQLSLDRLVALKTIRDRLVKNPSSLARFTREAYAAAQLVHHNVVQIYDFGQDSGRFFFSMEWVRGGPLSDLVKAKGRLPPRLAATYVLQAARGLAIAHRSGMVHRDIKPANLLLTDEGVVKVADLGLVKIPDLPETSSGDEGTSSVLQSAASGTEVTMQGTAVGTPAYMAPEQVIDAAAVDHRADIYSLGCTLYCLLTGKPPYPGSQVSEVLDGHLKRPIPDATIGHPDTPPELQAIIARAMAKRPGDRYETMSGMIDALSDFLGVRENGSFTPDAEQADAWSAWCQEYARATAAKSWHGVATAGLFALGLLLLTMTWWWGLSFLLLGPSCVLLAAAMCVLLGVRQRESPVGQHLREWIASWSWGNKMLAAVGALAALVVIVMTGLWWGVAAGVILGISLGAAYHFATRAGGEQTALGVAQQAEKFVRDLRLRGVDETAIRDFAGHHGGKSWRALYQAVFGYDSAMQMREVLAADPTFRGPTSLTLGDHFCRRLAQQTAENRKRRDQSKLTDIEKRGLRAEGLSASEANDRAAEIAAAIIEASKIDRSNLSRDDHAARAAAEQKRRQMKAMLADARSGKYRRPRDPLKRLKWALGGQTRLVAGLVLLTLFAIAGNASGLFDSLKEVSTQSIAEGSLDLDAISGAATAAADRAAEAIRDDVDGASEPSGLWSLGIAGLLLSLSAFVSGWRMTPFAVLATLVILFGAIVGLPSVAGFPAWLTSAAVGIAIYVPGVIWGETPVQD